MRSGGGASKGAGFERDCCRKLSLWLTEGKRDDLFWRVAMSGGRATLQFRKGKVNLAQVGDIGAIDAEGEKLTRLFAIECKFRRDLKVTASIVKHTGLLYQYWNTVIKEAKRVKREPLLIARQNNTPTLLIVSPVGIGKLGDLMPTRIDALCVLQGWRLRPWMYLFDEFTKVASDPGRMV